MKRSFLLLLVAALLFSCNKDNRFPKIETITSGVKWGIQIGGSPEIVYKQLQALSAEKKMGFTQVAIVYRKPYSKPQDIEHLLEFYDAITLQKNTGVIERVIVEYLKDTVDAINAGGALPADIASWPQGAPDETAIHKGDHASQLYQKLLAIYQLPAYGDYSLTLPDKPLSKPFDPDMANYTEWAFSMTEVVNASTRGMYAVRLYFNNGKLEKIRSEYTESSVVD